MKHQTLLSEFRDLLTAVSRQIETSIAMDHLDIARISENLFCDLFRVLFDWKDLRNLNAEDKPNFPAIDLADDSQRLAVQVTATANMQKIKSTLDAFLRNGFEKRYDRLIVYILTKRQRKYNQRVVDKSTSGRLSFNVDRDILDYRSLARCASTAAPKRVRQGLQVLRAYVRGVPDGLADEDLDPPSKPAETLMPNLIEVFFPSTLYIADLLPDAVLASDRQSVRAALAMRDLKAPSDYEVRSRQIITFHDLGARDCPFASVIDPGTMTPVSPSEFYGLDHDHENAFKSLLRFLLQQRLYQHRVVWKHREKLFVFHPLDHADNERHVRWNPDGGRVWKVRTVFERKMNKKDPTRVFSVKHLAFAPQFLRVEESWHLSVTPEWFFSYGNEFSRSEFANQQLSAVKRMERESSVRNHFRFWAWWLDRCDDMFSAIDGPVLTYGAPVGLTGAPRLNEDDWEVLRETELDDLDPSTQPRLENL